ncbi:MAG: hypothetical protein A2W91_07425 [Bacteroidetes bacterium GWF2_38_335]|nr:MAG: hypothetical protein A2W91_07425 [Bacteroidetes bacterium GWF2_38_335]OFY78554.1 MAG: hypothetical protein A2281_17715 [Bacteroidetes bacterium RIFOXYA12_FULL_38_20]HBS85050.1 DUF1778 domain-containing protein [Bacteroidales bacterium]
MKYAELKLSRFELRLSEKERLFFEKASEISGHKTLSAFVMFALKKHAKEVIEEHERFLTSEKDKEIFFDAILKVNEPEVKLKKAASKYLKNLKD